MKHLSIQRMMIATGLLVCQALPVWCSSVPVPRMNEPSPQLFKRISSQSVFLPISSIEWGVPDRWSFTARYAYEFDRERGYLPRRDSFTIFVSPGTDGGRLGIGYQALFSIKKKKDLGFFFEPRAIRLRTRGNPLETKPDRTFLGAEIRGTLGWPINIGVGRYRQIASQKDEADSFWGVHVGLGI